VIEYAIFLCRLYSSAVEGAVVRYFSQRPLIRYSNKLFIALLLQTHDAMTSQPIHSLPCGRLCHIGVCFGAEIPASPTQFLFVKSRY